MIVFSALTIRARCPIGRASIRSNDINTYDEYNADVVIIPSASDIGAYEAWWGTERIATGTAKAMRLITAGASDREASVYSVEDHQFLCGTIDQLAGGLMA